MNSKLLDGHNGQPIYQIFADLPEPNLNAALSLMGDTALPMWLAWGPNLSVVYNDAYGDLLGANHPAKWGLPLAEFFSDNWITLSPLIDHALGGKGIYRENLALTSQDAHRADQQRWFTFSCTPIRDQHHAVRGIVSTVWDTTEKIRMTEKLAISQSIQRESERQFRALFD
jgi:hypothetical protein